MIAVDIGLMIAVVSCLMAILGAFGGLLLKAFVKPLDSKIEVTMHDLNNLGDRIRRVEERTTEHHVQLDTLVKSLDQLVGKMDNLMTLMYEHLSKTKGGQ